MNRFKKIKKKETKSKAPSKASVAFSEFMGGEFLSKENVIRRLPFMFFVVLLVLMYIGYGYYVERTVKELYELEVELKELKSEYISVKSRLVEFSKQSQVAQKVKPLGLNESVVPPFKIEVEPEEMAPKK